MATFAAAVAPAIASACSVQSSGESTPFAKYGDNASYMLVPGGAFTSGASGWTLNDASAQGAGGGFAGSIVIQPGGDAISPPLCVSSATPTFRFYERQASGNWSELNAVVLWTLVGLPVSTTAGGQNPSTSWNPSGIYPLASMIPSTYIGSILSVRIEFIAMAGGGAVSVSDVYADPYSRS